MANEADMSEASELSGDKFRQILDTAPDAMVVVNQHGKIVFANAQTEKLFGYARPQLLGQSLDMLIPERFRPSHGAHVGRYFAHPGTRAMGSGLELFGRRADGTELAIEVSLSPVGSDAGFLVSAAIRDITERKRLAAAAKLSADRLTSAVESIQDAFALFDHDDRLVLCNSVYRRLIGDSLSGPLVGREYAELLDAWVRQIQFSDDESRHAFRRERISRRHEPTAMFDVRLVDGRSLRVIDRQTPEGGTVKTIWDLTEDEQRAEELRVARTAAEAGSAAKSDFLSSMSHELRTPLNAILGFAQLLQRDKKEPLSARHVERVSQILKGGEHLLRLIDDILDLSRIEAGGISISTEPVSVVDVLDEARRTLEPIAVRQGVRLDVEPPSTDLPMVSADRTRFVQILMNFGSNAIKYNRAAGKVTFLVSTPAPSVIRVAVRDTGMGIPADKQDKLFQPFQRAGQETGPIEGTGIGLVITKKLAKLMNGDVGFESAPGEGSTFWVDVPVHESGVPSTTTLSIERRNEGLLAAVATSGHRVVLYVEDNPANVTFMKDLLGSFDNIDLLTAPTAEMGIEIARSRRPEIVIMDINLPGMSGVDALRILRATEETKEIPVIALTAAASERDKQRGMQVGFYCYLTKPVKVDELLAALESILERPH
jgi:PAS domain S-box-containing protein